MGTNKRGAKVLLAVLGVTGVGKTSLINVVKGGERVREDSLVPCQ